MVPSSPSRESGPFQRVVAIANQPAGEIPGEIEAFPA
jgi:hypothetical protein